MPNTPTTERTPAAEMTSAELVRRLRALADEQEFLADDFAHAGNNANAAAVCAARASLLAAAARALSEDEKREADYQWIKREYSEMCERLQAATHRHHLGLGGERVDELVVNALDEALAVRHR